jgi:YVTN family beta-propeller protein
MPLAGMPPVADPANIYADAEANMLSPAVRGVPYRIYVPNSGWSTVTVIDPATRRVIGTYPNGLNRQYVLPGYDMRTLYVTNDLANSLTPINPRIRLTRIGSSGLTPRTTNRALAARSWSAVCHCMGSWGLAVALTLRGGQHCGPVGRLQE